MTSKGIYEITMAHKQIGLSLDHEKGKYSICVLYFYSLKKMDDVYFLQMEWNRIRV